VCTVISDAKLTDDAKLLVYGQEALVHGTMCDKKLELDIVPYSPREQKVDWK